MGKGNDENVSVRLFENYRKGKAIEQPLARIFCIDGVELRVFRNCFDRCSNFGEKCLGYIPVAVKIKLKCGVDFLLSFRANSNGLCAHLDSRARSGDSTSSQLHAAPLPASNSATRRSTSECHRASISGSEEAAASLLPTFSQRELASRIC